MTILPFITVSSTSGYNTAAADETIRKKTNKTIHLGTTLLYHNTISTYRLAEHNFFSSKFHYSIVVEQYSIVPSTSNLKSDLRFPRSSAPRKLHLYNHNHSYNHSCYSGCYIQYLLERPA